MPIIDLGVVNPTTLSTDLQTKVLAQYLVRNKAQKEFLPYHPFQWTLGKNTYRFMLSHLILHHKSASNPLTDRFEVISDEQLGQGSPRTSSWP